jgi:outer membrane lipoprotein carrier protein
MLYRLTLFFLFLFVLSAGVCSAEVELSDVVATLEAPFKADRPQQQQVLDFSAEFAQESHIASIDRSQKGHGQVSFKFVTCGAERPLSLFYWTYLQPVPQEIISNGVTLWVYQPDNRQAIASDISQLAETGDNPVMFLGSLGHLSSDFAIAWAQQAQDESGNYRLSLTPKQSSQMISSMEVLVDHEAVSDWMEHSLSGRVFPVVQTLVYDLGGNSTAIEFDNVQLNQGLDVAQFDFIAPEGVELIDSVEQLQF